MNLDSHHLGIIADDLTGACDVAACFTAKLGVVDVAISPGERAEPSPQLYVVNTQSRLSEPESARNLLQQVGSTLGSWKIVFKKIDAGLRGPLGAEISGLLEGLNRSGNKWKCVVAPAIPSIGRTTRGGIQYDQGIPIHQGELSRDPHSPPPSADIREIMARTGGGDVTVADAESANDLDRIVDKNLDGERVVFVGSLGLARALAQRIEARPRSVQMTEPANQPLLVCGSRHPQSARQMDEVERKGIRALGFDAARRAFDGTLPPQEHSPLVVRIRAGEGNEADQPTGTLLDSFVEHLVAIQKQYHPDGLGVIGGETAYHFLNRLGVRGLEVFGSHAEVIASSKIVGGPMDGCRFVSKGGSVGTDDAARLMLALLTT